jgi:hypothetical protein
MDILRVAASDFRLETKPQVGIPEGAQIDIAKWTSAPERFRTSRIFQGLVQFETWRL